MTEEENKKYDEIRVKIEAMTPEQRMERLDKLSTEIFVMANSFAGKDTSAIATYLHESVNNTFSAQKIFKGEQGKEIPVRFLMRSMGMGDEPMISMRGKNE